MIEITYDVCNLNRLYDPVSGYEFSMPRPFLESLLSGKAFDKKDTYTEEQLLLLKDDIKEIYYQIIAKNPPKEPLAVMTCGAPGSGKTLLLRRDLGDQSIVNGKQYAYIDPDDVCLKKMTRTYLKMVSEGDQSIEARKQAYNEWRPGSNAATHLILGNLIRENYAFYFGTTSTGPVTYKFFDFLKKNGYKIKLLHVSAPDDVRCASIDERDKKFVQTTAADIVQKGELLPQRINDTYLAYADEIEFYYRNTVHESALLAATWKRNESTNDSEVIGTLHVESVERYEKIKAIHNTALTALNKPDLYWENTIEKKSIVIMPNEK